MAGSAFDRVNGILIDRVILVDADAEPITSLNRAPVDLSDEQITDLKIITVKDNPTTLDNKLMINSKDYGFDIAQRNLVDHLPFSKLGFNPDVDDDEEDLWSVGGKYVWPVAEQRMEVVSTSGDDTATDRRKVQAVRGVHTKGG